MTVYAPTLRKAVIEAQVRSPKNKSSTCIALLALQDSQVVQVVRHASKKIKKFPEVKTQRDQKVVENAKLLFHMAVFSL
jgi:hypothetical protein